MTRKLWSENVRPLVRDGIIKKNVRYTVNLKGQPVTSASLGGTATSSDALAIFLVRSIQKSREIQYKKGKKLSCLPLHRLDSQMGDALRLHVNPYRLHALARGEPLTLTG